MGAATDFIMNLGTKEPKRSEKILDAYGPKDLSVMAESHFQEGSITDFVMGLPLDTQPVNTQQDVGGINSQQVEDNRKKVLGVNAGGMDYTFEGTDVAGDLKKATQREFSDPYQSAKKFPMFGQFLSAAEQHDLFQATKRLQSPDPETAYAPKREKLDREVYTMARQAKVSGSGEDMPLSHGIPKIMNTQTLIDSDIKLIEKSILDEKERSELGGAGIVASGMINMPTYMLDFAATGGMSRLGSGTAKLALKKMLKSNAHTAAGRASMRFAGWTAGAMTRASIGMAPKSVEAIAKRRISVNLDPKNNESPAMSILKGWGSVVVEAASETAGGSQYASRFIKNKTKLGKVLIPKFQEAWTGVVGESAEAFARKVGTASGFNGMLGEIGEERLATILNAAMGIEDYGLGDKSTPAERLIAGAIQDAENFKYELAVLAPFSMGTAAMGQAGQVVDQAEQDRIDAYYQDFLSSQEIRKTQGLREDTIESEVAPSISDLKVGEGVTFPPQVAPQKPTTAKGRKTLSALEQERDEALDDLSDDDIDQADDIWDRFNKAAERLQTQEAIKPETEVPNEGLDSSETPDNRGQEVSPEQPAPVERVPDAGPSTQPEDGQPRQSEEVELSNILKISADTPEELRMADIDRVMEAAKDQGKMSEFNDWLQTTNAPDKVKARASEYFGSFKKASDKYGPMKFEDFKQEYMRAFDSLLKYSGDQAGSRVYSDQMAGMSDVHPDWVDEIETNIGFNAKNPAQIFETLPSKEATSPSSDEVTGKEPKPIKTTLTDKSVRDHPQQVVIDQGNIKVRSKVGKEKTNEYTLTVEEWDAAKRGPSANEEWNFRKLIEKKFRESATLDDSPEGEAITDRLIDSQIMAIKKALKKAESDTAQEKPAPKIVITEPRTGRTTEIPAEGPLPGTPANVKAGLDDQEIRRKQQDSIQSMGWAETTSGKSYNLNYGENKEWIVVESDGKTTRKIGVGEGWSKPGATAKAMGFIDEGMGRKPLAQVLKERDAEAQLATTSDETDPDAILERIKAYKAGNQSPEKVKMYQQLGQALHPVRLQDAEELGRMYEMLDKGDVTLAEYTDFVKDLRDSGKIKGSNKTPPTPKHGTQGTVDRIESTAKSISEGVAESKRQALEGKLKPATAQEIATQKAGKSHELTYERYVMAVRANEGRFDMDAISADMHKQLVGDALAQGKPVPANVLAEYPGLAPKQDKAEAKMDIEDVYASFLQHVSDLGRDKPFIKNLMSDLEGDYGKTTYHKALLRATLYGPKLEQVRGKWHLINLGQASVVGELSEPGLTYVDYVQGLMKEGRLTRSQLDDLEWDGNVDTSTGEFFEENLWRTPNISGKLNEFGAFYSTLKGAEPYGRGEGLNVTLRQKVTLRNPLVVPDKMNAADELDVSDEYWEAKEKQTPNILYDDGNLVSNVDEFVDRVLFQAGVDAGYDGIIYTGESNFGEPEIHAFFPEAVEEGAIPDFTVQGKKPLAPDAKLAQAVNARLKNTTAGPLTAKEFFAMADEAYGGTRAQGTYGPSDAYDALELGVNQYIKDTFSERDYADTAQGNPSDQGTGPAC
jgi:hypothetical protein